VFSPGGIDPLAKDSRDDTLHF